MNTGDTRTFLFDRVHGYLLRTPAPYTRANAENHLGLLDAHTRESIEIVLLQVVEVTPAATREERDERATEPAPPPAPDPHAAPESERMCGEVRG